jgi:uncharacterized protein (TIRG00374 family)
MSARATVRVVVGLLCAVLFLWLALRNADARAIREAFAGIDWRWILVATAAYAAEYALRVSRWHAMLLTRNPAVRWGTCVSPLVLSYAVNAVLPLRAGDAIRCVAFNARLGLGAGELMATLFVERVLDFIVVLAFFGVALLLLDLDSVPFFEVGRLSILLLVVVLLAILLVPALLAPLAGVIGWAGRVALARRLPALERGLRHALDTLRGLARGPATVRLLVWSAAIWLLEGCVFLLVAMSLPSVTRPAAVLLALPVGTLSTLVPSTPGYVGTFDYFIALSMGLPGNSHAASLAFAGVLHAVLLVPLLIIGVVYLIAGAGSITGRPRADAGN